MPTVDSSDLVGVAEIAERLDRNVRSVHSWRSRYPDFPEPVAELTMGLVWSWPEVARWARSTGRLEG